MSTTAGRAAVPKYQRVREALRADVVHAAAGTLIASEHELCALHGVSRITVRRAIDDLIRDGLLTRLHGRGTVVAGAAPVSAAERLDLRGFHRQKTDEGHRVTSKVIAQGFVLASPEIARALALDPGSQLVRIDRVRSLDGTIDHLARTWMDGDRFADLVDQDFSDQSLYGYLEVCHGLTMSRSDITVGLRRPSGDEAAHLGIGSEDLRLATRTTTFDPSGAPRVHGITLYAGEAAQAQFTAVAPHNPR
ncbi:GntR family transcriptional regulator [Brachybacterium hainanense]|uniref:GntR family transcriptional regulator n=1 Tax=Brachybacterium hainanense TaxID=1541174 RepID=A0ABV6RA74_9MICO